MCWSVLWQLALVIDHAVFTMYFIASTAPAETFGQKEAWWGCSKGCPLQCKLCLLRFLSYILVIQLHSLERFFCRFRGVLTTSLVSSIPVRSVFTWQFHHEKMRCWRKADLHTVYKARVINTDFPEVIPPGRSTHKWVGSSILDAGLCSFFFCSILCFPGSSTFFPWGSRLVVMVPPPLQYTCKLDLSCTPMKHQQL